MNTKLYKQVVQLATDLLSAAEKDDEKTFNVLYDELRTLCFENEDTEHKNHPVQWETLGDFTEDSKEAIIYYKRAIGYAEDIQAHDYVASIKYAMALLFQEEGNKEEALALAEQADEAAANIIDADLQKEIKVLI